MRRAALLRGVNLGKRQLKSAEFKAALEDAGCSNAKTLLASGNAVFDTDEADARAVEAAIHAALKARCGLDSDVFVRDPDELADLVAANPFADAARDRPSFLVVMFFHGAAPADALNRLAARYAGPERWHTHGRALFIDFPDGQGKSNLYPELPKVDFPKRWTARNWNTVNRIIDAL